MVYRVKGCYSCILGALSRRRGPSYPKEGGMKAMTGIQLIETILLHPSHLEYNYKQATIATATPTTTTSTQAPPLSALAMTSSQRYRLYSARAILDPIWRPCRIQALDPELTTWCPGAGVPSQEVPSRYCSFFGPKHLFVAQNGPEAIQNHQTRGNGCYTPCARCLPLAKPPVVVL